MKRAKLKNAAELSRASGMSQSNLGRILNFRENPIHKKTTLDGDLIWRKDVQRLADFFNVNPEDMFSHEQLRIKVKRNYVTKMMSVDEVNQFYISDQKLKQIEFESEDQTEVAAASIKLTENIEETLNKLVPRAKKVIVLYHGLDGRPPRTFAEIAGMHDVTVMRIRQVYEKAMLNFQHPSRSAWLEEHAPKEWMDKHRPPDADEELHHE
jgi:DNA-directed RNA polymerase sigma subunit (sigma70/sigma32)